MSAAEASTEMSVALDAYHAAARLEGVVDGLRAALTILRDSSLGDADKSALLDAFTARYYDLATPTVAK